MENTKGFFVLFFKYKKNLIILATMVIIIIVITQIIIPTISGIFSERIAITLDETRLARLKQKEEVLKELGDQPLFLEDQKLNQAIPASINLPSILTTIQQVATETNMTLGEFSIASNIQAVGIVPVENAQELSTFHFKAALSGTLENVIRFTEKLASVSPLIQVEKIDFTQDKAMMTFGYYFSPLTSSRPASQDALFPINKDMQVALDKALQLRAPILE